ncbi:hypothetical protein [Saccharopolyspora sp. NPDC002376]
MDNLELHGLTKSDPHDLPTKPGEARSHAVKYDKSRVTDVVNWDGKNLNVIEAKGGGSSLSKRNQDFFHEDTSGANAYRM